MISLWPKDGVAWWTTYFVILHMLVPLDSYLILCKLYQPLPSVWNFFFCGTLCKWSEASRV